MAYFDQQVYSYMKKCNSFDHSTRSINSTDLNRLCHHFKIDYHSLIETVKVDSQGRIPFSELQCALYPDSRQQPTPPHYLPSRPAPPPPRQPPSHDINFPYTSGIPYETDESFTPDHDYTPEDVPYNPQEIGGCVSPSNDPLTRKSDYNPSWSNPGSPPDQGVPPPSHAHPQWDENYVTPATRRGGNYCTNCDYWQSKAQGLEMQLVTANRQIDRLQKDIQQSAEYYSLYQMVMKENNRYKQELKKLRDGSVSDGSGTSYLERQLEELKRSKEEVDASMKHYKRNCSALKQDNERLKYELEHLKQNIWYIQDEKQRLEASQLQKDAKLDGGRMPGYFHKQPQQHTDQPDTDPSIKDSKRKKQVTPADESDSSQSQVFVVLGEDVSSNVLPESLTEEKHYQIVCGLQNCHSIEELLRCLVSYGFDSMSDDRSQKLKVDNDHLRSQVKSFEAKYNTLCSSFDAAKLETEEMFRKISTVEANNCRLRRAIKLCQQACEVHEMLYEMKEAEARPPSTSSTFSPMDLDSPTRTSNHDINASKNILSRVRSLLKIMESNIELQSFLPTVHGKTSTVGWNLSMSQCTGTSGLSCSSYPGPEAELNSTEIEQLKFYYQALVRFSKHLLDTLVEIDGLEGAESVKEPSIIKDSISSDIHGSRILDMEDAADTEELCKIREEKAELRSQIYMMEQSKRSMELQLSRKTLYCSMLARQSNEQRNQYQAERKKKQRLKDKIKLMRSENPHMSDWVDPNEVKNALEAEKTSAHRYDDLFVYLQNHVEKSQNVTDKLIDFVKELLRANRALVEAFERAKKKQQSEKRQLKSELKNWMQKPPTHSIGQV